MKNRNIIFIQIPISVASIFILLNAFGSSSKIMSLTGIDLGTGVVFDEGIMMVENSLSHLSET